MRLIHFLLLHTAALASVAGALSATEPEDPPDDTNTVSTDPYIDHAFIAQHAPPPQSPKPPSPEEDTATLHTFLARGLLEKTAPLKKRKRRSTTTTNNTSDGDHQQQQGDEEEDDEPERDHEITIPLSTTHNPNLTHHEVGQIMHLLRRGVITNAPDLGGQTTAAGKGRYPPGITGWGGRMYSCAGDYFTKGMFEHACEVIKPEYGKCYFRKTGCAPTSTLVPERPLICTTYATENCGKDPHWREAVYKEYGVNTAAEKHRLEGKPYGYFAGLTWPAVETFVSEWSLYWRLGNMQHVPTHWRCWEQNTAVGIVT